MKFLSALALLVFISVQSFAQRQDVGSDKMFYLAKSEKYRKMATTGTVLAVGGTILVIVGVVTLSNVETTYSSYGQTTTSGNIEAGIGAYLLGVAGLGSGIPLWIIGGINHHRYERKFENVSIGLNLTPQRSGVKLTYRF